MAPTFANKTKYPRGLAFLAACLATHEGLPAVCRATNRRDNRNELRALIAVAEQNAKSRGALQIANPEGTARTPPRGDQQKSAQEGRSREPTGGLQQDEARINRRKTEKKGRKKGRREGRQEGRKERRTERKPRKESQEALPRSFGLLLCPRYLCWQIRY